ncbi:MAG: calcium/sodium antiporter [Patescibacteria group bacterium]|nr:calcium/sodium antiporter [Patescibacteria group bacterium]
MLIIWILVFAVSLFVLIKAADYFTDAASKLGLILGLSPFIVGVVIVGVGTSLPELASSISAVLKGTTEVVAGNVVGSNIANILLIIGLSAVIFKKIEVKRELINLDLPLLAGTTVILIVLLLWDGVFNFFEALVALLVYGIYIHYVFKNHDHDFKPIKIHKEKIDFKLIAILISSVVFICLGANYVIESVIKISQILNIGTAIISLSAVALGTSLPELFVSISAAKKKDYEMALGNVFGSNIFNGCVVIGIPALIHNLEISATIITIGLPFLIIATILYVISGIKRMVYVWEGALYVLIYFVFLAKIFNLF